MKNNTPKEAWEQEQYFKWVRVARFFFKDECPELQLINGSMNGVRVSPKMRNDMKAQGLEKGVPDIDIPIKRFPYSGLRIELKRRKGGVVSKEQKNFHELLIQQGYQVLVCYGYEEAIIETKRYIGID